MKPSGPLKNAVQPEVFNETPGSKGVSLAQTRAIQRAASSLNRGMTLLECILATAVLSVIMIAAFTLFRMGTRVYAVGVIQGQLEAEARRVVDAIAANIQESGISTIQESVASLTPPASGKTLTFRKCTGYDAATSTTLYGNAMRYALTPGTSARNSVVWYQDYGLGSQVPVYLADDVPQFLEQEKTTTNGLDDNGNGLTDEAGLCFTLQQNKVTVYLSATRTDSAGQSYFVTVNTSVQLRNK
jgi:prepilin-type N-terminal cleavage/methylation domain-containing protein